MHASWSRWLFGAWAVVTALWLVLAILMLIQTWPEPSSTENLVRNRSDEALSDSAVRGSVGAATPAAAEHVQNFLLLVLLPPGFLLALVLVALWIGGLPLPYSRRDRRDQLTSSRHAR